METAECTVCRWIFKHPRYDTISWDGRRENRNCCTLSRYIRWHNIGRALDTPIFLILSKVVRFHRCGKQSREVTNLSRDANKIRKIEIGPGYRGSGPAGYPVSGTHMRGYLFLSLAVLQSSRSDRYPDNFCGASVDEEYAFFFVYLKNRRVENTRESPVISIPSKPRETGRVGFPVVSENCC